MMDMIWVGLVRNVNPYSVSFVEPTHNFSLEIDCFTGCVQWVCVEYESKLLK